MPDKQTWTIENFEGGINNHADQSDIDINQFRELENFAIHRFGKLETLGGATVLETLEAKRAGWGFTGNKFEAGDNGRTSSISTGGSGLFTFATDRNAAGSASKEEWLLMADPLGTSIDAFAYQTGAWQNSWIDPGTGAGLVARFFYKDGAIRVSDANGSTGNYIKWKGFIDRNRYGQSISQWYETINSLTKPQTLSVKTTINTTFDASPGNLQIIMDTHDDAEVVESEWKKIWQFAASYVYDGNQESLLRVGTGTINTTSESIISKVRFRLAILDNNTGTTNNLRISHIKLYMREYGTLDWLLQGIYHINDGGGLPYEESVLGWTDAGNYWWSANTTASTDSYMKRPLDKYDYEFEAGHKADVKSIDIAGNGHRWKTAVVANRKTYAANTTRINEDGIKKYEQDAIYVSLPGQYDKFPANRKLETVGSDGEEIIRLMLYMDKILEFKDKTLRIINISGEFEFVEDTFYNAGIKRWEAAVETPWGICFSNRLGTWLYTGEGKPVNLLKRKVGEKYDRTISKTNWDAFYTESISTGYNPTQDQLIILRVSQGSNAKHCYVYTFSSQGWVYSPNAMGSGSTLYTTNFITDRNNGMVWGTRITGSGALQLYYWEDDAIAKTVVSGITGDIDFNMPGFYKYIYEIKFDYKQVGATLTDKLKISIDGENSFKNTAIGNFSESSTLTGSMPASAEWSTAVFTLSNPILAESVALDIDVNGVSSKLSIKNIRIVIRPLPEYRIV